MVLNSQFIQWPLKGLGYVRKWFLYRLERKIKSGKTRAIRDTFCLKFGGAKDCPPVAIYEARIRFDVQLIKEQRVLFN